MVRRIANIVFKTYRSITFVGQFKVTGTSEDMCCRDSLPEYSCHGLLRQHLVSLVANMPGASSAKKTYAYLIRRGHDAPEVGGRQIREVALKKGRLNTDSSWIRKANAGPDTCGELPHRRKPGKHHEEFESDIKVLHRIDVPHQ